MIEPQRQTRGISMTFPRFDFSCVVEADRTRLKQVVINLLSNALKYNRAGGDVAVECTMSTPDRVRISVRDTGEGLPPEKLAQLFQSFNRLGQEASAEEGTGIGLVVSKRLVELMGGVIGVESTVGVGSVFWIELVATAAPHVDRDRSSPTATAPPQVLPGARLRTLLYVEDNPATLTLVEQLIGRRSDMRLLSARNGHLGIEIARTRELAETNRSLEAEMAERQRVEMERAQLLEREQHARLEVQAQARDIVVTITDAGQGIDPEFLPHVFERFTQADGSASRLHGGLGLGMAIVRHLVELHGGSVTAASGGMDQGATFTVSLPIGARPVEGSLSDVERRTDTREVVGLILRTCGAQVMAFASAAEALETVAAHPPHVLVSAIAIPNGLEFIRKIRGLLPPQGGDVPTIALTAHAGPDDSAMTLAAGFDRHVTKPVDPAALITAVAQLAVGRVAKARL